MANRYDPVLKNLFLRLGPRLLQQLTGGHKITAVRNVELQQLREIKERKVDLLFDLEDGSLFHLDLQAQNNPKMPWRVLDYRVLLHELYQQPIRQSVLYVGESDLTMPNRIHEPGLTFEYQLIDIRSFTADELLATNRSGDAVLAFLASGVRDRVELAREIVKRVEPLPGSERRDALVSLLTLSSLRKSERIVMEVLKSMSLAIDWRENEFLREIHDTGLQEGHQAGIQEGEHKGTLAVLRKQIEKRFGSLPEPLAERLASLTEPELEAFSLRVLDAKSLDDLLAHEPLQ